MLRGYAKTGVFIVALVVLGFEGYLVYGWYDRYYNVTPSGDANGTASSQETPRSYSAGYRGSTDKDTTEGTSGPETLGADADPGEGTASGAPFVHRATDENSRGDYTYIDAPSINGDPEAIVLAVPSPDQGSADYAHNVGVWYEPEAQQWAIFNQDRMPVPTGAAFEVSVPPASEAFVHGADSLNIVGNSTFLDDPLTNGKPDAVLAVTQNWNPGGGAGVYNDHPVGILYDRDVRQWAIYNTDDAPMPGGAAFNVAVSGKAGTL